MKAKKTPDARRSSAPARKTKGTDQSRKSPHVNWQVDFDYLDKLDPASREWLEQFSGEFYKSQARVLQSGDQIRERWRAYKANQRDVTSRTSIPVTADALHELQEEAVGDPGDPEEDLLEGIAARMASGASEG